MTCNISDFLLVKQLEDVQICECPEIEMLVFTTTQQKGKQIQLERHQQEEENQECHKVRSVPNMLHMVVCIIAILQGWVLCVLPVSTTTDITMEM